jgi:hypothetical protein
MLSVGWLIGAVILTVLLTAWVIFTLTRLDRLHARVDAAQAALDAQLVRRAAALLHVVEAGAAPLRPPEASRYEQASTTALTTVGFEREAAENAVGHAITDLGRQHPDTRDPEAGELQESCVRVTIARRFYNDAVRDTRTLRARRMPRILHLAGHREMPRFFDIDETVAFPDRTPPVRIPVPHEEATS